VLGVSSVLTDHAMIAASGDSSQNALEPFPVKPPLNFEDDNDDKNDINTHLGKVAGNVTGHVSGLQGEFEGEGVEMHLDNTVGDNSSLPPEHMLYDNGYTFEDVIEFLLECLVDGIIRYQGHPTDK